MAVRFNTIKSSLAATLSEAAAAAAVAEGVSIELVKRRAGNTELYSVRDPPLQRDDPRCTELFRGAGQWSRCERTAGACW